MNNIRQALTEKPFVHEGKPIRAGFAIKGLAGAGDSVYKEQLLKKLLNTNFWDNPGTLNTCLKRGIQIYCICVLYLRSFFLKDTPFWIYFITFCIFVCKLIFPAFLTYTFYICIWFYIGITLICYDALGSLMSSLILTNPDSWLATSVTLSVKDQSNFIKRHVFTRTAMALIIGKTPMTATGRGAIFVAMISGTGYLINEELNRRHDSQEQTLNRQHNSQEQTLNRALEEKKVTLEEKKVTLEREKFEYAKTSWWSRK